jgi:osmotically-inducible protein OsmY
MTLTLQKSILGLTLAGGVLALSGCFPLIVGGAVTGTLVATDRRTSGSVLEDNAIQRKASNRIEEALGDRAHINTNSYNRQLLLTGEVPSEQDKQLAEKVVSGVENLRGVSNELAVLGNSTFTQRSSDALVTSRAKANLVDAKDLFANAFKVTTERGTVYLMGRVTRREADRATEVVAGTSGVQRVVRILEIVSEEDLAGTLTQPNTAPEIKK